MTRPQNTSPIVNDLNDSAYTESLVQQYLPLVKHISRRYARMMPDFTDDLFQIGCLGLLKAIRYYDKDHGNRASFKSFATVFIKGEIRHYLRDHSSLIQIPRRLNEINSKLIHAEEELSKIYERSPNIEELSKHTGYSEKDIREAKQSWENCRHLESFDHKNDDSDIRDENRSLAETLADKKYFNELNFSEDREVISQALISLGDRTKKIIEFVYFYDLTQKETAKILGLSEMGVSRTIKSALQKLKDILFTEIF